MSFRLTMISAANENGGNILHRFMDGHPKLFVYPFESQLGTRSNNDYLSSLFQSKYRWPEFALNLTLEDDYQQIWDQELKTRINQPEASKFKDVDIKLSERERKKIFIKLLKSKKRTRKNIVEAFIRSTFKAWKNYRSSGKEIAYLGFCPNIIVDFEKMINDFPNIIVIHLVRNPLSAYADHKNRPVPFKLNHYIARWNVVQNFALSFASKYPKNVQIVKYEDLVKNPEEFIKTLSRKIKISFSKNSTFPSWNGERLTKINPWGVIPRADSEYNKKIASRLSQKEKKEIRLLTKHFLNLLAYRGWEGV